LIDYTAFTGFAAFVPAMIGRLPFGGTPCRSIRAYIAPRGNPMTAVDFWFEFGGTYIYPTVARIGKLAAEHGVKVRWRPFLLMPIMIEMGMTQGPFLPYRCKLHYVWRDLERRCAEHGLPYRKPSAYPPAEVITSARPALLGATDGWCRAFTEKAFELHWTEDRAIGSADNIRASLLAAGQDAATALERARLPETKEALKAQTAEAAQLGTFGSPTFIVRGELFWGDIAWSRRWTGRCRARLASCRSRPCHPASTARRGLHHLDGYRRFAAPRWLGKRNYAEPGGEVSVRVRHGPAVKRSVQTCTTAPLVERGKDVQIPPLLATPV
jgi:2-hydroxychromene-2-carboxylate isomerase